MLPNVPIIPISDIKRFIVDVAQGAVQNAAKEKNFLYVQTVGIFVRGENVNQLLSLDRTEFVNLAFSNKLSGCESGARIEVVGNLKVTIGKKSGLFINFDVERWQYASYSSANSANPFSLLQQIIANNRSNISHGLQSRPFPSEVTCVTFIFSSHERSSVLQDIGGDFKEWRYPEVTFEKLRVPITSPDEVACAIANAKGDVLVIARGGGHEDDLATFNNVKVLQALNQTQMYRIIGIGHANDITLADFLADTRAQTPTAVGNALSRLLDEMRDRQDARQSQFIFSQSHESMEKAQPPLLSPKNYDSISWFLLSLGVGLGFLLGKFM